MKRTKVHENAKWYDLIAFILFMFLCIWLGELVGNEVHLYFQVGILTMLIGVLTTSISIYIYLVVHTKLIRSRSGKNV